ncbi:MAG: hypothetical protein OHK0012_05690 [Synechococcales cyanobacterium]
MSDQERFYVRLLALGMALVVVIILSLLGYVVWKTLEQMKEQERQ